MNSMPRASKGLYSGLYLAIVAMLALATIILFTHRRSEEAAFIAFAVAILLIVILTIVVLVYIYRIWFLLQDGQARTTPGKAVGFLFIPLFNLYWAFEAIAGLAQDYNKYSIRHGLNLRPLPEGLFTSMAVLNVLAAIPFVNYIALLPLMVVGFLTTLKIIDGLNELIDAHEGNSIETQPLVEIAADEKPQRVMVIKGLLITGLCLYLLAQVMLVINLRDLGPDIVRLQFSGLPLLFKLLFLAVLIAGLIAAAKHRSALTITVAVLFGLETLLNIFGTVKLIQIAFHAQQLSSVGLWGSYSIQLVQTLVIGALAVLFALKKPPSNALQEADQTES